MEQFFPTAPLALNKRGGWDTLRSCRVKLILYNSFQVASVDRWWSRYRKNGYTYIKSSTVGSERDTKQNYDYNPAERGKEIGACSDVVRQRLHEAGFEHILMKKPERNASTGQIIR